MQWFSVDKSGLAKLIADGGLTRVIYELLSNALDTKAKEISIRLTRKGRNNGTIEIEDDDPDGFHNLAHAFTLFAESERKTDPTTRGRFNLGEKLVLACCDLAMIESTTGAIVFDSTGRREHKRGRERGSYFRGVICSVIPVTQEVYQEACAGIRQILVPEGIKVTFNDDLLEARKPLRVLDNVKLPTVLGDAEGYMRRTERQTQVRIYDARSGEVPSIYELGIPVVETGDKWHVDVQQKVPLNMNRDNVTPAYLRTLRTVVLNAMHSEITETDANSTWVNEALADKDVSKGAVQSAITAKYGDKVAIADPSDPEANNRLVSQGYQLIQGASHTGEQWQNLKRFEIAEPAGRISPTSRAHFGDASKDSWIDPKNYTTGQKMIVKYAHDLARELMDVEVEVSILSDIKLKWNACYGDRQLVFNVGRLGHRFFDTGISDEVNALIIHEYAHHFESNHLDEGYFRACCRLGAKLARLALDNPAFFRR